MNYSIVIPIGKFSFFVHANINNIKKSTGRDDLDIVFLTSKDIEFNLQASLISAQQKHSNVRVLSAPFNSGSNHLKLLDWAITEPSLNEWMIAQHCDAFWMEDSTWLSDSEAVMEKPGVVAASLPNLQYALGMRQFPIVGDIFGVYKREELARRGLSFQWNNLSIHTVSKKVMSLIEEGKLTRLNGKRFAEGEFLDGSVAMSLELIAENPESIGMIFSHGLQHLMAFFRIEESIRWDKENEHLFVDLPFLEQFGGCQKQTWVDAFSKYSFLTSFMFDKREMDNPLPWCLMEKISVMAEVDLGPGAMMCEWLREYAEPTEEENIIGMDDLGIKRISFNNGNSYEFE